MLHCASLAAVLKPLAFVPGVLPTSAVGTGVAQTYGVICEPSSTGPPTGWLVTTSRAPANEPSLAVALTLFAPVFKPPTRPMVRPSLPVTKAGLASTPSTSTFSFDVCAPAGSFTSTSTEPPLTRSARFESVRTVVPASGAGLLSSLPPQAARPDSAMAAHAAAPKIRFV